jgi:replicative DNA helicase
MSTEQGLDAERAVLGAVLSSPTVLDDLAGHLDGADFLQPRHEAIWDAALAIHAKGDRPDVMMVAKHLGPNVEKVGGAIYLAELTAPEVAPVPVQAPHYAAMVREAALRRRLVAASFGIRQRAEEQDVEALADDCRQVLEQALTTTARTTEGVGASDLVTETLDALEQKQEPGISTGWSDLDLQVNGLRPGQLAIVGARPSVGKSVIAANVAAAASRAGVGVHFASLEMTRGEVMRRLLSAHGKVDLSRLMAHSLSESDWERLGPKAADVQSWPLWVDDTESQSLAYIRASAKRTARMRGMGLLVVDYLQLMSPRDRRVPREQQVGELSEGLKSLAKELRVPVLALAQVNRGPADRRDHRPMMSDLRESGRIEADADHVWLLHRQDLVDPNSTTGELEVIVAKNRNGRAGATVRLNFEGHYSRATQRAWQPNGAVA